MKVLVVKTSSLGDVVHTLPALSDAARVQPGIRFDWAVEEAFAEIPLWHPNVAAVVPVALRRWRRTPLSSLRNREWGALKRRLAATQYDRIIDAQGLLKSALITRLARGPRIGLDRASASEPLASLAYDQRLPVPRGQHAITRVRLLFAQALDYPYRDDPPDYGLCPGRFPPPERATPGKAAYEKPYVVFLHATSWASKEWPEAHWIALGRRANQAGLEVVLPGHSREERDRAARIATTLERARVVPPSDLTGIASLLSAAVGAVGVDTGLSQLAAALGVPAVTLYGATHSRLTGAWGAHQRNLDARFPCAPCLRRNCAYRGPEQPKPACYTSLPADRVWRSLEPMLNLKPDHQTG